MKSFETCLRERGGTGGLREGKWGEGNKSNTFEYQTFVRTTHFGKVEFWRWASFKYFYCIDRRLCKCALCKFYRDGGCCKYTWKYDAS